MKLYFTFNLLVVLLLCISSISYAQLFDQPCHGQDTVRHYRVSIDSPVAIAVSNTYRVAVAQYDTAVKTSGSVYIWNRLFSFMFGQHRDTVLKFTSPEAVAYDRNGYLYVLQTERTDSNILIFNPSLSLVKVINNTPGSDTAWSHPRAFAFDSAQNLYVISDDSVATTPRDTTFPKTGKLIQITNPLTTATKRVLLYGLNAPKGVSVNDTNLYITENKGNKVSRYTLTGMRKTDSIMIAKPVSVVSTGCKLYCSEDSGHTVKILNALDLSSGVMDSISRFDTGYGPLGITVDYYMQLFVCDYGNNKVVFYDDIEDITDTDIIPLCPIDTISGGTGGSGTGLIGIGTSDGTTYDIFGYGMCVHSSLQLSDTALGGYWNSRRSVWSSGDTTWSVIDTAWYAIDTLHRINDTLWIAGDTAWSNTDTIWEVHHTIWEKQYTFLNINDTIRTSTTINTSYTDTIHGHWLSSNIAVVTVDTTGLVYAVSDGSAIISFIKGEDTLIFTIYVNIPISGSGRIYTYGYTGGLLFDSLRICVNSATQLFDSLCCGYWTVSNSIALIDESNSFFWPISAGSAQVYYTSGNMCGTVVDTLNVLIDPVLYSGIITGPDTLCAGATITLIDTASGGAWSTQNHNASVSGGVVRGVTSGTDIISYSIVAPLNTCGPAVSAKQVTIYPAPYAGTITGSSNVCIGSIITLTDSASGGVWGSSNANATDTVGVIRGISYGTDSIFYSVTNNCGTAVANKLINIERLPDSGAISGSSVVCVGASVTLSESSSGGIWSGTNTNATVIGDEITGNIPGLDTILYAVTNVCRTSTAMFIITIDSSSPPHITGSTNVCVGDSIAIVASLSGGFWNNDHINTALTPAGTTCEIKGLIAGIDTVTYAYSGTCGTFRAYDVVTINPLPDAGVITGLSGICSGATTTLSDTAGSGIWSITNTHASLLGRVVTGVSAGMDTVSYTVINICGKATTLFPMSISESLILSAHITATPSDTVKYAGEVTTFNATVADTMSTTYQWYLNRSSVPGATSSVYSLPVYGNDTVYCMVTNHSPCIIPNTDTSNIILIDATYLGIDIEKTPLQYYIYPNPADKEVTIQVKNNAFCSYTFTNALGVVVLSAPLNGGNTKVNITTLSPGVYNITLNGTYVSVRQFLKL